MCRIAAWIGPDCLLEDIVVQPSHSLLEQSQNATESKLSVNGDGFGFAWYDHQQTLPGLYRVVLPAWSDSNLVSLCRMIRAPLFIAHVRASTIGEVSRSNCHPFSNKNWSFCHNGQIPDFPNIRRSLESDLPDDLYNARRGTTDSEMLFLKLLANGLADDPVAALQKTLAALRPDAGQRANRATLLFSDGQSLFACRHATDNRPPTLYTKAAANGGTMVASEPLDEDPTDWTAIPPEHLMQITPNGQTVLTPLTAV